jgi:integrase
MARVELKGIANVRAKGRIYYYAWRGGPRLHGEPGSADFVASFLEAHEKLKVTDDGKFEALVNVYKASDAFKKLADSTRRQWAPWLDQIADHFGTLRIAQFNRVDKIKPAIKKWRSRWTDHPRSADYGMQVLSRVLSYAVEEGRLTENACTGIAALYSTDRSEIIWTDADIKRLRKTCSPQIAQAVDLAAHTGLRFGDLIRLSWAHVHENRIELSTGKSRHRREALIPMYTALQDILRRIPKRATTVLTNSRGRPWTGDGLGSSFNKAKIKAGLDERKLHFHDLRGTAATKFYVAEIKVRAIAEILGWSEGQVERIIRRYVGKNAYIKAMIEQIDRAERRT